MRIAILAETYTPYVNGVVTHIQVLREGLLKLGHEVMIITADPDTKDYILDEDNILRCPAIKLKSLYGYGLASPVSRKRRNYLKEFNPDIIHIHQEFGIGLFGVLSSSKLKIPLVYTLHTMYDEYIFYVAPKIFIPVVRAFSHSYSKFLAKRAAAITGPSLKVDEYFKKRKVDKQVHVIDNSIELSGFDISKVDPQMPKKIREELNISKDKTVGIFIGRLGREKSIDFVLKALAEYLKNDDRFHLIIVGGGPSETELKELTTELGIDNMVSFIGKVDHSETINYYAASDVFITASLTEMMSISMLEAMSMGLPVIQRYDPLNKGQIKEGINGYLYREGKEMIDILMNFHALPPDEKSRIKQRCRDSISSLDSTDLASKLLNVYNQAIESCKNKTKK